MAREISVRENTQQLPVPTRHHRRAGAHIGHRLQDRAHRRLGRDERECIPRTHDLVHAQKQAAPHHSARMKAREILLLKSARLQKHHRQRIAQREHDRRARSRRQVQRARLLFYIHVQQDLAILRQGGLRIAAEGDDSHLKTRQGRQDAQQFLRLPARAQRQNHVAIRHHPEIPMHRVQGIEHHRGRAGARERGRDFRPDVTRLPDPENHHLSPGLDAFLDDLHRARKAFPQPLAQPLELKNFYIENTFRLFKILHAFIILRRSVASSKNLRAAPV